MIVRDTPSSLMLFFVRRGSIVPKILPHLLFMVGLATAVAFLHTRYPDAFPAYTAMPFTVFGVALSIALSFRNDACYARWWEARLHWGQVVIDCRSLARLALAYIDADRPGGATARRRLTNLAIVFPHVQRRFHRGTDIEPDIRRYLGPEELAQLKRVHNGPEQVLRWMSETVAQCNRQGLLSDILVQTFDTRITSLCTAYACCERTQKTPLPFVYTLFLHRTAYLFCWLLPFGLVPSLGYITPLVVVIVTYTFFGLDALSEALENPFNESEHNLPLTAISRGIEISVLEALGETDLPEPIKPVDYYLD